MSDLLVLCYHAVSEQWPAPLAVRSDQLKDHLELLVRRGFRGATFSDALRSSPRGRTVVVTFDDAFHSVLELAHPILASLGLPGTVFAVSDFASTGRPLRWPGIDHWEEGPHNHELRGLRWPELARLADDGWEVGSHTLSHPRLTQLNDEALARELRESRAACEQALGRPCRSLAYPYGDVDRRVVAAAAEAGYEAAAALPARPHAERVLEWPRIGAYRADTLRRFRLKVSPTVRVVREVLARAGLPPGRA